jgi:hypothetical protein
MEASATARAIATQRPPARQDLRRKVDAEKYLALVEAAKLQGTWTDPTHGKTTLAPMPIT